MFLLFFFSVLFFVFVFFFFIGDLRLEDGISPYSGRLEVYYDNKWRSVCGPKFGILEAQTACQQIGYGHVNTVLLFKWDNTISYCQAILLLSV